MKEAIILAGGFGTRLQGVVKDLPKPMAPVHNRPFLTYIFDNLADAGCEHIVLSTGYLHEKIEEYFGGSYRNLRISYAREEEPLGTGGAIRYALSFCETDRVLVLNGDTIFKVNWAAFSQFHQQKNALLAIVLRQVDEVARYGSVSIDPQNRITLFAEKNAATGRGLINGGIYLIDKKLFEKYPQPQKFSFEKDVMERLYQEEPFYGLVSDGYFLDIGIPEDYARAEREL